MMLLIYLFIPRGDVLCTLSDMASPLWLLYAIALSSFCMFRYSTIDSFESDLIKSGRLCGEAPSSRELHRFSIL